MLHDYYDTEIVMNPYYPCIKYRNPADPKLDGTDYFIVAESMYLKEMETVRDRNGRLYSFNCSLSFTCEKGQKVFYKLKKDCLRFRIPEESFDDFRKHSWLSLILIMVLHYE